MKIAVTAPPWISIPPAGYGGTERVVYNLVEGLVTKGHDVVLYATGDSMVTAKLEYYYKTAVGNNLNAKLNPFLILDHIYHFYKSAKGRFDIIHDNSSDMMLSLYFSELADVPCVYTLHGAYAENVKDLFSQYGITQSTKKALQQFSKKPFVSISNKQRDFIPELNYVGTVHNSIILSEFTFGETGGDYIAWLGRVNYTKGVDTVLETARMVKKPLILAPFIDKGDLEYYEKTIKPSIDGDQVKSIAEVKTAADKSSFLGAAKLFLFPIRWDEPFGIVMIEAMATGTPPVAFAMGAAPEVIKDGETGFLINPSAEDIRGDFIIKKTGQEGLCEAVERIYSMSAAEYGQMRKHAREHVEQNFTVTKMVDRYEQVYKKILDLR